MVLTACLSLLLRLCPFVDLRGELLLEEGAQEAVEEEPSRVRVRVKCVCVSVNMRT